MKTSLVVASPTFLNKSTDYGEVPVPVRAEEMDWHLLRDDEGKMRIVDVHDVVDGDIEPNFVAFDQVVFRLFTRNNPTTAQTIRIYNDADLTNSFFNPSRQTRFTIHGSTNKIQEVAFCRRLF